MRPVLTVGSASDDAPCAGVGGLAQTFNTLTGRTWTVQQPASTPIALPGR